MACAWLIRGEDTPEKSEIDFVYDSKDPALSTVIANSELATSMPLICCVNLTTDIPAIPSIAALGWNSAGFTSHSLALRIK